MAESKDFSTLQARVEEVIRQLQALADPEKVRLKQEKFGIQAENAIGVYHQELKPLAKAFGPDESLAKALFETGIYECRLLCSKLYRPGNLTEALMETWVQTFENWEITDSFCMGLFAASPFALAKIEQWTLRQRVFEKRAGFVIMAAYGFRQKSAPNQVFESFFPLIEREADDDRLYVKKAVNWALRNIGKRNADLRERAVEVAEQLLQRGSSAADWIARDALRELQKPGLRLQDYPRAVYRNA